MSPSATQADKYDVELGQLAAKLEVSAAENDANVAVVEHTLAPHSLAAPLHRHSREDEISYDAGDEARMFQIANIPRARRAILKAEANSLKHLDTQAQ